MADSALVALKEVDALVVNAWRKLDEAIDATDDPNLTCAHLLAQRRSELSATLLKLWRYIDDLAERSNRRAEHFEAVARKPAPPLDGRAESERVMARVRSRAELAKQT